MQSETPLTAQSLSRLGTIALALICLAFAAACKTDSPSPIDDSILEQAPLYSQGREEVIIRHFFQDERGGLFVDIGCYHWKDASTTYYLEEKLGWSGIAVDAQDKLRRGYEANRKNTKFFSYFVSEKSNLKQPFYVAGPVSSGSKDHLEKFPRLAGQGQTPSAISVETISLNDLLEGNGIEEIDFLSIDVEGFERNVLDGFNIDKYKPRLACVSAGPSVRKEVIDYFDKGGYEPIPRYSDHDNVNLYFRPAG